MNKTKSILRLAISIALTFTFSCSSGDEGGGGVKEVVSTGIMTNVSYDANGGVSNTSIWRIEYEYDSKGNATKMVYYSPDGSMGNRGESEYDSYGNQIKTTSYYADGSMISGAEKEYDSKGNLTKMVGYYYDKADGSMNSRHESEYDSYGNQIKMINYKADGSINSKYEWEYNCNSDGNYCTYTNNASFYNSKGEISSTIEYTGEVRFTTINSYRLVISKIEMGSDGSGSKIEGEYDSKGSQTKRTDYNWQSDTNSYVKTSETTITWTYIRI